jgi:hypothetical protein
MAISWCRGCLIPLGASNFRSNRSRGTGKMAYCRDCDNQRRTTRRKIRRRERLAYELGQRFCRECWKIKDPETFSMEPHSRLYLCNSCLAARAARGDAHVS